MMIGCPSTGASSFCRMRATTSVNPPGPNGTMIFTGREGYVSAHTGRAKTRSARAARAIFFMAMVRGESAIDGLGLRKEPVQDVVDHAIVLLLEARVRNARHHRELLVGVREA